MRDPNRIRAVLRGIEIIWSRHPDMRLSQLLLNTDMNYNTEEPQLMQALEALYGGMKEEK